MGDFQLEYDAAIDMAKKHETNADDIEANAKTLVTSLDGGEGAPFILSALAAVAKASGQVGTVNESAAKLLRKVVDVNKGIDDEVEGDFRSLEEEIP